MERGDRSWSEKVPYLCKCGLSFRAIRHRWVDAQHQPERRERVLRDGPLERECPSCGTPARGRCSWLELHPGEKKAVLVLGSHQRGELSDELIAHLKRTQRYPGAVESWYLRPDWRFENELESVTSVAASSAVPVPVASEPWAAPAAPAASKSKAKNAFVAQLELDAHDPVVDVVLDDQSRRLLSSAALRARPALLRLAHGYPLLSLRVVGSYLGQTLVIDAVADPAKSQSVQLFRKLSEQFRVRLQIRDSEAPDEQGLCREIAGPGLERNAKFCLDSALEVLAIRPSPEPANGGFEPSLAMLEEMDVQDRLHGAKTPLPAGSFKHLLMPEETRRALLELDSASNRNNLRHLLEVDGLSVVEYEDIRQRVLASALEQGLCAPLRFWPRILKLGLAPDFTAYAQQLAENRQRLVQSMADDLSAEDAQKARNDILILCQKKKISLPPSLEAFLRGAEEPTPGGQGQGEGGGAESQEKVDSPDQDSDGGITPLQSLPEFDGSGELFFESSLLEEEVSSEHEISAEIDDDMDRLFPRHSIQGAVEFMPPLPPPAPPRPKVEKAEPVPSSPAPKGPESQN